MQPDQPNPWVIVNLIFVKMVNVAGAKEKELQGASSFSGRISDLMKAAMGEGTWKPNEKLDATQDET